MLQASDCIFGSEREEREAKFDVAPCFVAFLVFCIWVFLQTVDKQRSKRPAQTTGHPGSICFYENNRMMSGWGRRRKVFCLFFFGRWTNLCSIWPKITANSAEKGETRGAQNRPRRFAPRPILGGGGVVLLRAIWLNVVFNKIMQIRVQPQYCYCYYY